MKPVLHSGQLIKWKDDRGFGFIKPNDGGKEVFLHISALKKTNRRPQVGDTILYERVVEVDGKIRAANASIQGIVTKTVALKHKQKKQNSLKTLRGVITPLAIAFLVIEFNPRSFLSPIQLITKPECIIKGNISVDTGNKIYHLRGMEDYESTIIDPFKGEKWFCSESEAIANGWRKAPR